MPAVRRRDHVLSARRSVDRRRGPHDADTPEAARAKLAALVGLDEDADKIAECVGQAIGSRGSATADGGDDLGIRVLLERLAVRLAGGLRDR